MFTQGKIKIVAILLTFALVFSSACGLTNNTNETTGSKDSGNVIATEDSKDSDDSKTTTNVDSESGESPEDTKAPVDDDEDPASQSGEVSDKGEKETKEGDKNTDSGSSSSDEDADKQTKEYPTESDEVPEVTLPEPADEEETTTGSSQSSGSSSGSSSGGSSGSDTSGSGSSSGSSSSGSGSSSGTVRPTNTPAAYAQYWPAENYDDICPELEDEHQWGEASNFNSTYLFVCDFCGQTCHFGYFINDKEAKWHKHRFLQKNGKTKEVADRFDCNTLEFGDFCVYCGLTYSKELLASDTDVENPKYHVHNRNGGTTRVTNNGVRTCMSGYTQYGKCSDCGTEIVYAVYGKLDHEQSSTMSVIKAPTATETGIRGYLCVYGCGTTLYQETMPTLGNDHFDKNVEKEKLYQWIFANYPSCKRADESITTSLKNQLFNGLSANPVANYPAATSQYVLYPGYMCANDLIEARANYSGYFGSEPSFKSLDLNNKYIAILTFVMSEVPNLNTTYYPGDAKNLMYFAIVYYNQ